MLPLDDTIDHKGLMRLVGQANKALGEYNGLLQGIINPEIMLSPLLRQEAVLSSKIEGTQATERDVLEHEAGLKNTEEKTRDSQEVMNYRQALRLAESHLKQYPIQLNFICGLHKILMDSVRGRDKKPGEFRKEQNWIGEKGCAMAEAIFIPPSPLLLNDFLQNWFEYLGNDAEDPLLQTAIMHAQFELLHPFMDGNGRIGRILIPLFLFQKKALIQPMFYLSEYLENNRDEYYFRLQNISQKNDWNGWFVFFLQAVNTQAKHNSVRVTNIMNFYNETVKEIQQATNSKYTVNLLDAIFDTPIFYVSLMAKKLSREAGMDAQTAADLLRKLKNANIIEEVKTGSGRRSALFSFDKLLQIAESGVVK